MSFTINPSKTQSGEIIDAVRKVRAAREALFTLAPVIDNMTAQQIIDLTGFSGTEAQLKTTISNANTVLSTNVDLDNLSELLTW